MGSLDRDGWRGDEGETNCGIKTNIATSDSHVPREGGGGVHAVAADVEHKPAVRNACRFRIWDLGFRV